MEIAHDAIVDTVSLNPSILDLWFYGFSLILLLLCVLS